MAVAERLVGADDIVDIITVNCDEAELDAASLAIIV